MASFPVLKTGAIAQYPADRTPQFSTQTYRVSGWELSRDSQRFPAVLQQWTIKLALLDEGELEALRAFFLSQEGRAGSFSFTDPWTGTVYANCSFGKRYAGTTTSGSDEWREAQVMVEGEPLGCWYFRN